MPDFVPLDVPSSSLDVIFDLVDDYDFDDEAIDDVRRISGPVVAAELRRLADEANETASGLSGEPGTTTFAEVDTLLGVVRTLRARADELDPR
jgi:hypothetical protein